MVAFFLFNLLNLKIKFGKEFNVLLKNFNMQVKPIIIEETVILNGVKWFPHAAHCAAPTYLK